MFQILQGGFCAKHNCSFVRSSLTGLPNFLLLIIHTAGTFQIGEQSYFLNPGHALIIAPKTPYRYSNPEGVYMDDWIHFHPTDTEKFYKIFPAVNIPVSLEDTSLFTPFIRQILWEHAYSETPYREENIDALFSVLLNHLKSSYKIKTPSQRSSYKSQLQSLRLEIKNTLSQQHTIEKHAREMGLSESYFQHLYSEYFGISFQKDLIRLRIEQAQYLLATTDATMEEISRRCGYSNPVHFYRQFKACTGTTPRTYRKNGSCIFK